MARESFAKVVKRRLLGVVFIAVIAGLVTLSIAIYNKAFTPTVDVLLKADHTGNELLLDSDVKERGIIVGSVRGIQANGSNATVTLALDPSRTSEIPKNVTARILPKTLFGEEYVSLQIPRNAGPPIQAGDVIPQDRSKGALEAEAVLGDMLPLLTAVQPAELNDTLNAIATALQGRGQELGRTLVNLDKYLQILNPHTQQMVDDLHKLGEVALEYNNLAPDIFTTLKNLQTSARTVLERRQGLDSLLTTGASSSDVLASFLSQNRQRMIDVVGQTAKIYPLLAQYSSEYPCVFAGVTKLDQLAEQAIYNHDITLSLTLDTSSLGPYRPGNQPTTVKGYGPQCFGLPNPPVPFDIPGKYRCLNDGAPLTGDKCAQRPGSPGPTPGGQSASYRMLNSPAENALVNSIVAGERHTKPQNVSGTDTLLEAPLLRGTRVVVK